MGRPRKLVDDVDLFRWQQANRQTVGMAHKHTKKHGSDPDRKATLWFMHQFDAVIMWQAFTNQKPLRARLYHREQTWDIYCMIRKLIDVMDDVTVTNDGRPVVSQTSKLAAMKELREFQRIGASLHKEFLMDLGKPGVATSDEGEEQSARDPIIASLKVATG